MKIITRVLLTAFVLMLVAHYIPGIHVDGVYAAIVAAVVLGLLNLFVRPILIILTLPITVLTLGLFMFVVNALLFWFAATFLEGFSVDGFWYALLGSLIVSIASAFASKYIK